MFCCSECFSSPHLKQIINSNPQIGDCSFCHSQKVAIYDPKELSLIFQNILDLYIHNPQAKNSIDVQIEIDFAGKIFSSNVPVKALLQKIISQDLSQYSHLFSQSVSLNDSITNPNLIKPLEISWEKFASEIISTNRFHLENVLDLVKLKNLLQRYRKVIKKGKTYFRARVSGNVNGLPLTEMKNPPREKAKAGRANPPGISYLYIADEMRTTLYEARVALYDYVTIGEFQLLEDIEVINLRGDSYDPLLLADDGELADFLIHLPFITKLEQELSKPRRRSDNELDYLPTQYLCEFIKSMGFDGVEYQSSLHRQGFNLAIFTPDKLGCNKVEVFEIVDLDLKPRLI